jgi:hypothetical protein
MFRVGDVVVCVDDDNGDYSFLTKGRKYTVKEAGEKFTESGEKLVTLTEAIGNHYARRFGLAAPKLPFVYVYQKGDGSFHVCHLITNIPSDAVRAWTLGGEQLNKTLSVKWERNND